MSKEETNKYWVTMSHETETNYSVEATSQKQVQRLFKKMLEHGTVSETGIDYETQPMEDARDGEVRKGGVAIADRPALLSLTFEGHGGERKEEVTEIKMA